MFTKGQQIKYTAEQAPVLHNGLQESPRSLDIGIILDIEPDNKYPILVKFSSGNQVIFPL